MLPRGQDFESAVAEFDQIFSRFRRKPFLCRHQPSLECNRTALGYLHSLRVVHGQSRDTNPQTPIRSYLRFSTDHGYGCGRSNVDLFAGLFDARLV
jgi:hypothetical protein